MAGVNGQGTRTRDTEVLPEAVPISAYVMVFTKDELTFRGALVGNSFDQPCIELRGAQIAEFAEGLPDMRWKTLDWPVLIYREQVSYIMRRP